MRLRDFMDEAMIPASQAKKILNKIEKGEKEIQKLEKTFISKIQELLNLQTQIVNDPGNFSNSIQAKANLLSKKYRNKLSKLERT